MLDRTRIYDRLDARRDLSLGEVNLDTAFANDRGERELLCLSSIHGRFLSRLTSPSRSSVASKCRRGGLSPPPPEVRERPGRCRQPVGFFAGRRCARIERERAVGVVLQRLVLRAERVAFERVGIEQVLIVVERQRPEAFDRRQLPFFENERVQGYGHRHD
jgi:hypothetical protein